MNISYKWLKDYVDFDLTPDKLADALTSVGLETGSVECVESIRGGLRGIVIGRVLTCEPHPNSDHLHITTVDLGGDAPVQIVCGAPNVAAGQCVVVATVGTTLYDGDKEFQIKKSKIRGVESFGMICAEDEIGIGTSHDGIIVLDPATAPAPGTPAATYYNLSDDYVLEVDLTPNRIDAASHYGVARDLAAYLTCHVGAVKAHRPDVGGFKIDRPDTPGIKVSVDAPELCTRYCGVTVRGVRIAPSPDWLQQRLSAAGIRPINNVVDITNYILHAFCQPLHAFDAAKIGGGEIHVRRAAEGVKFTTLDGEERTLTSNDLVIADAHDAMCIAGVFGGLDSGVTDSTVDIFLESACFNPTSVRRTARRHALSTDSSFRFERGVDPNGCIYALKLAATMVKELAGGNIDGDIIDIYPEPVMPAKVVMRYDDIDNLLGGHIEPATVDTILDSLEINRTADDTGALTLEIPTYRVDVTRPCDVIEDILRIYGYNNIAMPDRVRSSLSFKTTIDASDDLRRTIADQLTGAGYNEILNNSLTAEAYYSDLADYPADCCVRLLNPLSQDLCVLRQTMIFGGLESLAHNINRRNADVAAYEFGNVYRRRPDAESTAEAPLAPYSEAPRLALWLTGNSRNANWARQAEESTVFDLKAAVMNILARLGIDEASLTLTPCDTSLLRPALAIATRSGKQLGTLGIVRHNVAAMCQVKQPVAYAELDWHALTALSLRHATQFKPLAKTHPVKRDLSLLLDTAVTMADVERTVRESERRLLRSVSLFDVYEGKNLPAGKKSYAITMTLQDDEKTLNDKQIDAIMNKIIGNLRSRLGAELR